MAAGILAQLSTSEESSDEQNSVDGTISITSSASCSGIPKSAPLSERGDIDSSSSASASTSAADTSKRTAPSLISVLQQAKPSELSRKRVIRNNLPPKVKKRKTSSTTSSSSLKSVTPRDRCNQFPKDYFNVSGGKLFVDVVEKNCR